MLEVLSGLCASLCITIATLLLSLALLVPDHLLDLCSPEDLLLSLELKHLFVLSLLCFVHGHFFLHFLEVLFPSCSHCLILSVTHLLIVLNPHVLLMSLLVNSFLLLALVVAITLTHLDDVVSPLLGLVDLLPCLRLFILKQLDAVRQKLGVLLGSLSRHLGLAQLLVQCFHVVVGIEHQVVLSAWRRVTFLLRLMMIVIVVL